MSKKVVLNILLATLFLRWQTWTLPLNRDEGAYAYMATRLSEPGFMLYRDAFEHKPPGIHILYWAAFQFFGQSEFTIRLLGYFNAVAGSIIVYYLLNKSRLFTGIYMLISNSFILEGQLANTEMFMVTFLGASLLLVLKRRYLSMAGLLAGLSCLLKPVAFTNVLILLGLLILTQRQFILSFISGLLLPSILVVLWFYSSGAIADLYLHVVLFNRLYVESGLGDVGFKVGVLEWLWRGHTIIKLFLLSAVLLIFKFKNIYWDNKVWLFLLWFIAYFVGAKLTSRNVLHYYFPLIQGWTILFGYLWTKRILNKTALAVFAIFLIGWGWLLFLPPRLAYERTFGSTVRYAYDGRSIGRSIADRTKSDDKIFFWIDEPEILFYSGRLPVSKHINTFALLLPGAQAELKSGLNQNPEVIITYAGTPPDWLQNYLDGQSYQLDKSYSIAYMYYR